jgi:hypothetical protein
MQSDPRPVVGQEHKRGSGGSPAPPGAAPARRAYLDRLRVGLVAAIIAVHGMLGYAGVAEGAWPYQSVQEATLGPVAVAVLGLVAFSGTLFMMGLFFLVAGLLAPGSLARRGAGGFVRARLWRLGLPLVIWVLLIWPLLMSAMHSAAGPDVSYRQALVLASPPLDTGPMWFVELLLLFSLAYAAWSSTVGAGRPPAPPTARVLFGLGVAVAAASFLVRTVFPLLTLQPAHLNLWQWPQYLALFWLGTAGAGSGWLGAVPDRLRRACGVAALLGVAGLVVLFVASALVSAAPDAFTGGWNGPAAALSVVEATLAIGASVWLLGAAQRHLDHPAGPLTRALGRACYAAFVLQGPVLIGLALALRSLAVSAEMKAITVGLVGVLLSFGLGILTVRWTPLRHIL